LLILWLPAQAKVYNVALKYEIMVSEFLLVPVSVCSLVVTSGVFARAYEPG